MVAYASPQYTTGQATIVAANFNTSGYPFGDWVFPGQIASPVMVTYPLINCKQLIVGWSLFHRLTTVLLFFEKVVVSPFLSVHGQSCPELFDSYCF